VLILCGIWRPSGSQDRQLVWADEFNGPSIDTSVWQFESGLSNDNLQYYTDRTDNANITEGVLQITALKESYQGFEYTSAHMRTEKEQQWRYGRMEARIRLPGSPGFVPAFWMLPADQYYGWWPFSGEIDIMEHPSNEVTKIYGTVHTEKYNLFSGPLPPQGGVTDIPDAESAFHLYAVEWTPEKIDFFVDDQKYYSFENDGGGTNSWPFDQPFYIILNLAVGGGWVGTPNENTLFPAVMEVDFVRVYQDPGEVEIQGADFVTYNTRNVSYHLGEIEGTEILWSVPGGARIISGQGTPQITADWGIFGGEVIAEIVTGEGTFIKSRPVKVSPGYLRNPGFEKGVNYWRNTAGYPARASFLLHKEDIEPAGHSVFANVTDPGGNPWDVQLSQQNLVLQRGTAYRAGLMVRSEGTQEAISAAVINASTFAVVGQKSFTPSQEWDLFEFTFTAPSDIPASFNIDMGGHTGSYYIDQISLTTGALTSLNLVRNPDFFEGEDSWTLVNHSTAVSAGGIEAGEYVVSITNGGENAWDIHLGQTGLPLEQGFEYLFSFDAYADAPRQITALAGKNGEPWTVYNDADPVSLTTTRQTYTIPFTMTEPTDLQSRLGFDIGGAATRLYFDNILLRKGEAVNTGIQGPGSHIAPVYELQSYPNPVRLEGCFYYVLGEPARVSLGIYNLNGQKVSTVVSDYQAEGEHRITWKAGGLPPGIYFYRFEAGAVPVTGKLTVVK
jgi:beta-glucanase (GH16 family)